jgi:hypothetical protein
MSDTAAAAQANGATNPGGALLPGPAPGEVAAQRGRASRASTRAALLEAGSGTPEAKPATAVRPPSPTRTAPAKAVTVEPVEESGDETAVDPTEEATEEQPAGDAAKPAASGDGKPDPELAKRLESVQAAEKRSRDKITKERAELETERKRIETEWAPRIKAAKEFETLKAQAKRGSNGLVAAVRAIGFTEADFYAASQILYASSPEAAKDTTSPQRKAAADRALAERYQSDEVAETKRELTELKQQLEAREQKQQYEATVTTYLDHTVKAIDGATAPLAKRLETANPAKLRAGLWAAVEQLTEEDGDVPSDMADVVARFERNHRAELEQLGIDPATLSSPTTTSKATTTTDTTKKNNQAAEKKQPAKTLGNDLSTTRVPRSRSGERDRRAETRRMVESGQLG